MRLNLKSVEERVKPLGGRAHYDREFIFELLGAYGRSSSNITRLRNGSLNVADDPTTEVAQKNVVYFKETTSDPLAVIDDLRSAPTVVRYNTRFVIVTDYAELLAVDTKTNDSLAIQISDIDKHFTFFLPWAGMEKAQYVAEAHADVKAAERMAKLFDELVAVNPELNTTTLGRHALNVFFTRLLFCFFAEDTGIFSEGQFTQAIGTLTQPDGSDVSQFLTDLFAALDTAAPADKPKHLEGFPHVNGRLFKAEEHHKVPVFNKKARDLLLESGRLLWNEINPDIFGSMFQAVVTPGQRADLGQHYTSVPNILKTIEPLFLDDLKEQFDVAFDHATKLEALLRRIGQIKVFDPACGSGNFLVIAYKELRKLEHAILERLAQLDTRHQTLYAESKINIENFFGIELDDFAVEIAILSLWIAKHQMNREFFEKFRLNIPLIPLKEAGTIKQGNATRVDWDDVCPGRADEEVYLIGNPPYAGSSRKTAAQKDDESNYFGNSRVGALDYIAIWFSKAADYVSQKRMARFAFLTTSSVHQGVQATPFFRQIASRNLEVLFAFPSFKWANNAKNPAGVNVSVIGVGHAGSLSKFIESEGLRVSVERINMYLNSGPQVDISARRSSLAPQLPKMTYGSKPVDGGHLTMSARERGEFLRLNPQVGFLLKKMVGSEEIISSTHKYCLWIEADDVDIARATPDIEARLNRVRALRASSPKAATQRDAATPWRFAEPRHRDSSCIGFPAASSERRDYVPIDFFSGDTVIHNKAFAIYDAELWLFGLLTSRMHMAWAKVVAGRSPETRLNYSNTIVYNTFPVPNLTDQAKDRLTEAALRVLDTREYNSEKTLAELYDPGLMPDDLRLAHQELDGLVDSIYSPRGFDSDEQRLSHLFGMYEQMTAAESAK